MSNCYENMNIYPGAYFWVESTKAGLSISFSNESSFRESESGNAPGNARFNCFGRFHGAVVLLDIS